MGNFHHWLPGRRDAQLEMAQHWLKALENKAAAWHIPPDEVTALAELIASATQCLQIVLSSDRTATTTAQCKMAFHALIVKMRFLKGHFFLSPPLSNTDYVTLDLKPHKSRPTIIPVPVNQPGIEIIKWAPHILELRYFTAAKLDDGEGDYGIRVYYGLVRPSAPAVIAGNISAHLIADGVYELSAPPMIAAELPSSFFTRRMKYILVLPLEASGLTCYLAARFENSKGNQGPWGTMIHALVP
jgi:hypothetical protein